MPPARRLLLSLPGAALDLLRAARTGVLLLLGPIDFLQRKLSGRGDLPPLRLRRHTGPLESFESSAAQTEALLRDLGLPRPDDTVVDIGCGAGAMAPAISRMLGPRGRYLGLDLHAPSIRWCRARFAGDPRLRFEIAGAGASPDGLRRFPVERGSAGFVLAKSLFTHLTAEDARGCLSEIRRTLAPGGAALVTAFLFDGASGGERSSPFFPFPDSVGAVRWRWKASPRSAIAFDRAFFEGLIASSGLRVQSFRAGFWPAAPAPAGQDVLLLAASQDMAKTP